MEAAWDRKCVTNLAGTVVALLCASCKVLPVLSGKGSTLCKPHTLTAFRHECSILAICARIISHITPAFPLTSQYRHRLIKGPKILQMLAQRINARCALKTIEPLYDYILIRVRVSYTMVTGRSPYRVSHRHAKSDRQGKTSNGHCGPASTLGARAN